MNITYLENKSESLVIKFMLLENTIYWSICDWHKDIALLLGDKFNLEHIRGAGMIDMEANVTCWDSIGYRINTPYNIRKEIQELFLSISEIIENEVYKIFWKKVLSKIAKDLFTNSFYFLFLQM